MTLIWDLTAIDEESYGMYHATKKICRVGYRIQHSDFKEVSGTFVAPERLVPCDQKYSV